MKNENLPPNNAMIELADREVAEILRNSDKQKTHNIHNNNYIATNHKRQKTEIAPNSDQVKGPELQGNTTSTIQFPITNNKQADHCNSKIIFRPIIASRPSGKFSTSDLGNSSINKILDNQQASILASAAASHDARSQVYQNHLWILGNISNKRLMSMNMLRRNSDSNTNTSVRPKKP